MCITHINNIISFFNFNSGEADESVSDLDAGFVRRAVGMDLSNIYACNTVFKLTLGISLYAYSEERTVGNFSVIDKFFDNDLNVVDGNSKSEALGC